jgi:conjugal transfer pilus assembly protein TraW
MKKLVLLIVIKLLVGPLGYSNLWAREMDFGNLGKTYHIQEEDLLEVILKNVKIKMPLIQQEIEKSKKEFKRKVYFPEGIKLPLATTNKTIFLNPQHTLSEDIKNEKGEILFAKGTTINPFKIRPLTKKLCFIDGDDDKQVKWLLKNCNENPLNKFILISGSPIELMKKYKMRFFFDSLGSISKKINIKAVPSLVGQHGDHLYVQEFKL